MIIPAGPWLPDLPDFGNPGLPVVRNCLPDAGFYRPFRGFAEIAEITLAANPRGLFVFRRGSQAWVLVYGGGSRLYEIASRTLAPSDISRGGGTYLMNPGDRWRGLQFGNAAILTNYADVIQTLDTNSTGSFANLGGNPPRAKYIANVRGRVMLAYTNDPVDGELPTRIWWHGFTNGLPDLTAWAPSLETTADFQQIVDLGPITGLTGGEFGTVLCEEGIARVTSGGPFTFQVENVSSSIGCTLPESVIRYGRFTYFYGREGWQAFDGMAPTPIGKGKIDRWFARDMDFEQSAKMWAAPVGDIDGTLGWLYCGAGHNGRPNRMLCLNALTREWSVVDIDLDLIAPTVTFGGDLDDVTDVRWADLDAFTGDMDDPALWARNLRLGGLLDNKLRAQVGTALDAVFQSPEIEMVRGGRMMLNRVATLRGQGTATVEVARRERPGGPVQWTAPYAEQGDGVMRCRERGRYHAVRSTLAAWDNFQGWDVDGAAVAAGGR
jgi:hypothetical protein